MDRDGQLLVIVFLRGGADGLTLVPPVGAGGDDDYARARGSMAVPAATAFPLDDRFALHPELAPLHALFEEGQLAVIPACGSEDGTRSHFEAQDLMEHGGPSIGGGWLGRLMRARRAANPDRHASGLAAVSIGTAVSESLRGAPGATALRTFEDLALDPRDAAVAAELDGLYRHDALLAAAARGALTAAARLDEIRRRPYRPEHGARYGDDPFSAGMARIAALAKTDVGLEAATIDLGGWDTHILQDQLIAGPMQSLAGGLHAFATDLGPLLATTSIVVMTEFGRRLQPNSALGTDHGRGGVMLVIGGGVLGGVHGRWPGLDDGALEPPGDVAVAQSFRDVLAPVIARAAQAVDIAAVFPSVSVAPLPL